MKHLWLFIPAIIFVLPAFSQSGEVTLAGSQTKQLTSSVNAGQEYVLQVTLPAGYSTSNKKYPVVYVMDAQWDFPLVCALYGQQYYDGFIPEMIIVGVTWGGIHPNADSLRARDYTPTKEKRLPQSGGADNFLLVLKEEIFPFVESNYRVDSNNKTLMGCSLGGLFTLYTLFTHPGMFNRYIAASPAFMWDNEVLYQYEKTYFNQGSRNLPATLFMCVGGVETSVPGFEKLTSYLKSRHYPDLKIESKVLENTGHSGTKGEGYARGLQFVFKRPSLKLPENILKSYEGTYQINTENLIRITASNGGLIAKLDNTKYNLLAASETDFYLTSSFLNVHFMKDEKGNVSGFQLGQYGSNQFVNKLKNSK